MKHMEVKVKQMTTADNAVKKEKKDAAIAKQK